MNGGDPERPVNLDVVEVFKEKFKKIKI